MHPGEPIRVEITKWGDRPHWTYAGTWLGSDEHGEWLGFPAGTHYQRPGMEFVAPFAGVVLVPAGQEAFLAAFNDERAVSKTYVDMATPATWDGSVLRSVDLDLDVVMLQDGTVYLDDEDEFAEHQVAYGYPPEIVAMAESSAGRVLAAVRGKEPPFDDTAQRWLDLLG
jgi:hypothetical protein